ncbi:DUF934 domain-containing protein [Paraburkholderia hospita]|uniref:DUF934 domain-containing protein n=1 Tax=Paraburkholderia hospita TaxID=169430 RepID=A0AAN1MPA6_9BURK|nr:DUF934 domain-containing protein [Paraburkholderia hospita]AUT74422.1 DUF934 domain-containing protein [Paraburkholderia hospita]EIN01753.1 hypothetical protein WQE_08087 [Paraburkholderia hospita]OUL78305.1 hypothetical protein CA601_36690 [Paraburkholderia hospita]OUL78399.1 hypothetical protein CA602_31635 [Paraburkholderia hospita]SEH64670.1 protein of unknown function [Paraburkholderia hospita]
MNSRIRILAAPDHLTDAVAHVVALDNDADPFVYSEAIAQAERIELHFPNFTDGRAFSQAYLIRRRLGFSGDLRATGDVLADQLIQMERTGFSSAVLAEGVDPADAQRQLDRFAAFYQGDVARDAPFRQRDR